MQKENIKNMKKYDVNIYSCVKCGRWLQGANLNKLRQVRRKYASLLYCPSCRLYYNNPNYEVLK